jgi:hypothetical protein
MIGVRFSVRLGIFLFNTTFALPPFGLLSNGYQRFFPWK